MGLYVARPTDNLGKDEPARLIKAKTAGGAMKFAVKDFYEVELADAETAAALAGDGVKVEDALAIESEE